MDTQLNDLIPEDSITIGEFAKQTQLSLKALRLYHEKGLLMPAYIDPCSGYRYYLPKQVKTAHFIRMLREMDMPLAMIEKFMTNFEREPAEASAVLQRYLQLFDARATLVHTAAEQVSQLLEQQESQMQKQEEQLGERELCLYDLPPVQSHRLLDVLKKVLDASEALLSPDRYRLLGTTASILHGAKTPSKGVDFLMRDRESVDAFHLALAQFKIDSPPTYLPEDKQYWASYFVDGVHIGVTTTEWESHGDHIEPSGDGPWTYYTSIPWGQHNVPTVNLELRLVSELFRNRADRYEPLIQFMSTKQVDVDLLRRGMAERQIPEEWQVEVIGQLN